MVRIDINVGGTPIKKTEQRQAKFLSSEAILRYLLENDDMIDTLICCKPQDIDIITSDFNLYEALGSTKNYDNININKLTKLLEVVNVISYKQRNNKEKPILKEERVEEIRKQSLPEKNNTNDRDDQEE